MNNLGISAFMCDNPTGQMEFRFAVRLEQTGQLMPTTLRYDSPDVEPLCYPLFHWFGEKGYNRWKNTYNGKQIHFMEYLRSRLMMPEQDDCFVLKTQSGRYIRLSRLMQYFVVENVSRSVDYRLEYERKRQPLIFGEP